MDTPAPPTQLTNDQVREIIASSFWENIRVAKEATPHLFDMEEATLLSEYTPTATDSLLRMAFWGAVQKVQNNKLHSIGKRNVFEGICQPYQFDSKLGNNHFVAYMLCPLVANNLRGEEALNLGMMRIREILAVSPISSGGNGVKVDTKLAAVQLKIVEMLDKQLHGEAVQRHLNINVGGGMPTQQQVIQDAQNRLQEVPETSYDEIRERIRELEALTELNINDPKRVRTKDGSSGDKRERHAVLDVSTGDGSGGLIDSTTGSDFSV